MSTHPNLVSNNYKPKANCSTIDTIIRDIVDKQTRMETENEWNIMSLEDLMIMALAGYIKNIDPTTNYKSKKKSQGCDQEPTKSKESTDTKSKSKEDRRSFPSLEEDATN